MTQMAYFGPQKDILGPKKDQREPELNLDLLYVHFWQNLAKNSNKIQK